MAEAAMIPCYYLAYKFNLLSQLIFTTREPETHFPVLMFKEPHSHAPDQAIIFPNNEKFDHIIIVEDEITTGVTLINLVKVLADYCNSFTIIALCDINSKAHYIRNSFSNIHVSIYAPKGWHGTSVEPRESESPNSLSPNTKSKMTQLRRTSNPPAIPQSQEPTLGLIRARSQPHASFKNAVTPRAVFVIGECIGEGMLEFTKAPSCVILRHITRSPWVVDNVNVLTRVSLGKDEHGNSYFYYNPDKETKVLSATIFCWYSTRKVAHALWEYLRSISPSMHIVIKQERHIVTNENFESVDIPWNQMVLACNVEDDKRRTPKLSLRNNDEKRDLLLASISLMKPLLSRMIKKIAKQIADHENMNPPLIISILGPHIPIGSLLVNALEEIYKCEIPWGGLSVIENQGWDSESLFKLLDMFPKRPVWFFDGSTCQHGN
eukprot:TRINITY_DN4434_c0_g1_i4.p1 TRINITY_DN4434_c0_g1~~TRINITY_DN4434_c0_g1_i4.p1  ORF type:complete len:508 (-),score=63.63 TRINITY_DN4434_c0_g1_i4:131-1435(-)